MTTQLEWVRPTYGSKFTVNLGVAGKPIFEAYEEAKREWKLIIRLSANEEIVTGFNRAAECVTYAENMYAEYVAMLQSISDPSTFCACGFPAQWVVKYKTALMRAKTFYTCTKDLAPEMVKLGPINMTVRYIA